MAKGNLILGTMSGKLGDVVAYTNNGKQCARVRRRQVKNPNSPKQQVQRMVLSTVSQFVSAYRPVLNNGFEGKQKGASSLSYARKLALNMLRTADMYNTDNGMLYVYKGAKYAVPNTYRISEGIISIPDYEVTQGTSAGGGSLTGLAGTPSTALTASQLFDFAPVGLQHTFVFHMVEENALVPSSKVVFAAIVFTDDTTPALVAAETEGTFKFNTAALDMNYSQGAFANIRFAADGAISLLNEVPCAAGYILSAKDGSRRSVSTMALNSAAIKALSNTFAPDVVVDSYDNEGVDSGAPAEYYLDNNNGSF